MQESIGDTSSIAYPITGIPSLFNAQLSFRLGNHNKQSQLIAFDTIALVHIGDADFIPTCSASSSLPITFTSMNTSVATIVKGKIHLVGIGTAIINASQSGDTSFIAAPVYGQLLTVSSALPIGIKNFSATIKSKSVLLEWDVANEIGNSQYQIEKSIDEINFTAIGIVSASNNNNYSFNDASFTLPAYYRIKLIGTNGDISYSNSLFVSDKSNSSIAVFPNPVSNNLTITGLNGQSLIKIVNNLGQIMLVQKTSANSLNMDLSTLKEGVYILSISDDADRISIRKFIKK